MGDKSSPTSAPSSTQSPKSPSSSPAHAHQKPYLYAHANALAGALAGASTALLTCPLDVIRTRFQVKATKIGHPSDGALKTAQLMLKEEGLLSFYKGMGPQLVALIPSWAIYFTVYDHLKPRLSSQFNEQAHPSLVHLLSAVGAGAVTNLGTTPLWTIKTRLQTQHVTGGRGDLYDGGIDCVRKIIKSEGIGALWAGFVPSLFGLIHVAIQFPLYEKFKTDIRVYRDKPKSADLNIWETFACAASSKVLASAVAYPHELIRSRLQAPPSNEPKYKGVVDVVRRVVAEEGFRAFYRGLGITLTRTVPASMITLTVYEKIMSFVKAQYE